LTEIVAATGSERRNIVIARWAAQAYMVVRRSGTLRAVVAHRFYIMSTIYPLRLLASHTGTKENKD
jgi:hypothetical protein